MSETRFICKRCWRRPALSETWYRCPQCGQGSQGDEWLRMETPDGLQPTADILPGSRWGLGGAEASAPRCREHPDSAIRLFCPCEEYLPPRAELHRGDSLGLGFAGPQGAGKTVMILTMVQALQRLRGPDLYTPRVGLLGLGDTETAFQALADRLRNGEKPDRTFPEVAHSADGAAPGAARNFCWELTLNGARRARRWGFLAVYDVAGESWGEDGERSFETLDRYLEMCTSLVFLVDGVAVARDLGIEVRDVWDEGSRPGDRGAMDREWLGRLLDRLHPERAAHSRLAVVVSKADLLWQEPRWQALRPQEGQEAAQEEALAELLRESDRGQLLAMAAAHFREVRPFAASSLGFTPTAEVVQEGHLLDPPKPEGVVEPILWLLEGR